MVTASQLDISFSRPTGAAVAGAAGAPSPTGEPGERSFVPNLCLMRDNPLVDSFSLSGPVPLMRLLEAIKVIVLAALVGGLVAISGFLVLDRVQPGAITIGPGEARTITVTIEGAVEEAGTYTLLSGARLNELVIAAGGFTAEANTSGLNMAGRLADGDLVMVPTRTTATPDPSGQDSASVDTMDPRVNINTASLAELDQLPGIGPTLAQRIIDFREFNGPFTTVDQLAAVTGISQSMVDELRDLVTIGG
jgi:competence protein ComEA